MALLFVSLNKSTLFQSVPNRMLLLLEAMCLANVVKFFMLPIIIWKTQQSDFVVQLNFMLFFGYFISALIHVHSGTIILNYFNWNRRKKKKKFQKKEIIFQITCVFVSVISGFGRIFSAFSVISSLVIKSIMMNILIVYLERNLFLY